MTKEKKLRNMGKNNQNIQVITAAQAANLIEDGATVAASAFGMAGWPEEIGLAVEKRFLETGHPSKIRHIHCAGIGNWNGRGENAWAHNGLIERLVTSHPGAAEKIGPMIADGSIMTWFLPLGTMLQAYREIARKSPGILTKIGMGTFIDPRQDGGKVNQRTKDHGEDLVEYIPDFRGEDYLFYKSWHIDVGIMRGTYADEHGNISCDKESHNTEMLVLAQAVKACGGTVIVQVESIVPVGEIHPKMVKLPGIYVDYLVVEEYPERKLQTQGTNYNPAFTGEERVPLDDKMPNLPFDTKKVICRRAAKELWPGCKANFGIGMPTFVGNVISEEGCRDLITMVSESGNIGGVPGVGKDFGAHWNVEASSDHGDHFLFFDGGGLDIGVFGLSEVDKNGNVNTSMLNGVVAGVGGFINIAQTARKAVFMGTFTTSGIETEIKDGKLVIVKEGKIKKFVDSCPQLTFIAEESLKLGNEIIFITERCVLERKKEGLVLTEIAPGVDLQKDILDQMGFVPIIPSGGPKLMDPDIFEESWGKLIDTMQGSTIE